ncbi:hypothetical protein [Leptospira licerasiae]|uniref:hypothetical protein n=1 Tax=Leptospira licerasiae TaxID=447106 RepID=UPI00301ADA88
MKGKLFFVIFFGSFIVLAFNCFLVPTNQREACRYNLKEQKSLFGPSDDSCNGLAIALYGYNDPNLTVQEKNDALLGVNFQLLNCIEYYQKLKQCDKEINKYIPTLHPE